MDGTVCGAHSNQAKHGKGGAIKSSDVFCASLCARCHHEIDNGNKLCRDEAVLIWEQAFNKTRLALQCVYDFKNERFL
jgi:hypothetical protein